MSEKFNKIAKTIMWVLGVLVVVFFLKILISISCMEHSAYADWTGSGGWGSTRAFIENVDSISPTGRWYFTDTIQGRITYCNIADSVVGGTGSDSVMYADSSGYADTTGYSLWGDSAVYSDTSDYATYSAWGDSAIYCDTTDYALYGDSVIYSDTADYSLYGDSVNYADTSFSVKANYIKVNTGYITASDTGLADDSFKSIVAIDFNNMIYIIKWVYVKGGIIIGFSAEDTITP